MTETQTELKEFDDDDDDDDDDFNRINGTSTKIKSSLYGSPFLSYRIDTGRNEMFCFKNFFA